MEKTNITKRQKKILTIGMIVASAFLIFLILAYLPLRRELVRVKDEFSKIESEIAQIKKMAGGNKSLEESIVYLKDRLEVLNKKFPEQEEAILRELSDLATRLRIDISAMRPQKKQTIKEIGDSPINIKGCYVQEMPILVSLKTSYKKLVDFLKALKEDFSAYIRVDSLQATRTGDKSSGALDVDLNLDSYLICKENN